jgi:hypothetical protein
VFWLEIHPSLKDKNFSKILRPKLSFVKSVPGVGDSGVAESADGRVTKEVSQRGPDDFRQAHVDAIVTWNFKSCYLQMSNFY